MARFSEILKLSKTQAELDFVDIDLEVDTPLYLDPYALTSRDDEWSEGCNFLVTSFFETVLAAVRTKNQRLGAELMRHLGEPEETMLGVSQPGNKGRGIGPAQAADLFNALANSAAAKSGLLEDLSDFALFVPNIGRDKISDMTTNIIRSALIDYTASQCRLLGVPLSKVASGFYWDPDKSNWVQGYTDLPIVQKRKILLVPKYAVRYEVGVDPGAYRNHFVLEFLQAEHMRADDGLVTVFKDSKGRVRKRVVYKKTVDQHYPKSKDYLAEFSKAHPDVIEKYRETLRLAGSKIPRLSPGSISEPALARHLAAQLVAIPPGAASADDYHKLMTGIVSFLYFPNLIYPHIEAEINQGRKRIDILYTNGKESGLFYRLSLDPAIKANIVHVECKNYSTDIANPEFDQLIGRFDHNRGRLGLLLHRSSDKPDRVTARARDAAKSAQGIVLALDDKFVLQALKSIEEGKRYLIDSQLDAIYRDVVA